MVAARRSYLALVAVCSFWGTIPLVAERTHLSPPAIVFGRVWLAALGLGAALVCTGPPGRIRDGGFLGRRPVPVVAAGVLLAAHWTAMFAAYDRAPDDVVAFIVFLAPVGIALLAPRTLGERIGVRTAVALGIAVGGLLLVAGPGTSGSDAGLVGLACAGFAAASFVALVLLSKPLSEELGGLRLTFLEMLLAGVVMIPVALTTGWGHGRWGWLLLLGLVHTGVGTALYLTALSRVPATHVGILGYLEPVGVVAFAWLIDGASPRATTLVGGLLIVAAGAAVITAAPADGDREEVAAGVPG